MQELLEKNCDYLHELIEKPLDPFLDPNTADRSNFFKFRGELINYYGVTKKVIFMNDFNNFEYSFMRTF